MHTDSVTSLADDDDLDNSTQTMMSGGPASHLGAEGLADQHGHDIDGLAQHHVRV